MLFAGYETRWNRRLLTGMRFLPVRHLRLRDGRSGHDTAKPHAGLREERANRGEHEGNGTLGRGLLFA